MSLNPLLPWLLYYICIFHTKKCTQLCVFYYNKKYSVGSYMSPRRERKKGRSHREDPENKRRGLNKASPPQQLPLRPPRDKHSSSVPTIPSFLRQPDMGAYSPQHFGLNLGCEYSWCDGALRTDFMLQRDFSVWPLTARVICPHPSEVMCPGDNFGDYMWRMVLAHSEQQPQLQVTQRSQEKPQGKKMT